MCEGKVCGDKFLHYFFFKLLFLQQILSHTGLIDSNSEVEAYLHKVLKDGVAGNNARNDEMSENARVGNFSHTVSGNAGEGNFLTL